MEVIRTTEFKANYSKLLKMGYKKASLDDELGTLVYLFFKGERIPDGYDDHQLEDNLSDYRELHFEGDLLLVYRKTPKRITLVNIGTHRMVFKTRLMKRPKRRRFGLF